MSNVYIYKPARIGFRSLSWEVLNCTHRLKIYTKVRISSLASWHVTRNACFSYPYHPQPTYSTHSLLIRNCIGWGVQHPDCMLYARSVNYFQTLWCNWHQEVQRRITWELSLHAAVRFFIGYATLITRVHDMNLVNSCILATAVHSCSGWYIFLFQDLSLLILLKPKSGGIYMLPSPPPLSTHQHTSIHIYYAHTPAHTHIHTPTPIHPQPNQPQTTKPTTKPCVPKQSTNPPSPPPPRAPPPHAQNAPAASTAAPDHPPPSTGPPPAHASTPSSRRRWPGWYSGMYSSCCCVRGTMCAGGCRTGGSWCVRMWGCGGWCVLSRGGRMLTGGGRSRRRWSGGMVGMVGGGDVGR